MHVPICLTGTSVCAWRPAHPTPTAQGLRSAALTAVVTSVWNLSTFQVNPNSEFNMSIINTALQWHPDYPVNEFTSHEQVFQSPGNSYSPVVNLRQNFFFWVHELTKMHGQVGHWACAVCTKAYMCACWWVALECSPHWHAYWELLMVNTSVNTINTCTTWLECSMSINKYAK